MDWELIVIIIVTLLLLLAGGYIKRLTKEIKDLVDVFLEAIADQEITKEELDNIIFEAKDVRNIVVEIAKLIARR